jgi:hypothetical protein
MSEAELSRPMTRVTRRPRYGSEQLFRIVFAKQETVAPAVELMSSSFRERTRPASGLTAWLRNHTVPPGVSFQLISLGSNADVEGRPARCDRTDR